METKKCKNCKCELKGRADKKFCDSYCKSSFHNKLGRKQKRVFIKINSILRRNRKILETLFQEEKPVESLVSDMKFLELGYNFNFQTHYTQLADGRICYCCYDFGYLKDPNGKFVIIRVN